MRLRRAVSRAAFPAALCIAALAGPASADPNNNNSEKLTRAVTLDGVRTHQAVLQEIADAAGGNRFAGLASYDMSAAYVKEQLDAAGYITTYQEFVYPAFFENSPSQLEQISPNPTVYVNGVNFATMSYSGSGNVTANLVRPTGDHRGCNASDWAPGSATGKIAIVQRGAPAGFPVACTFRLKADNAFAAGAAGLIVYNNVPGALNGTLGAADGLDQIPVFGIPQALGESLVAAMTPGPVTMRMLADTDSEQLTTRNVLAESRGGDPNNVVLVGAHLDSVSAGPGINDNGSGSAAILETAIQMSKVKPRNKVRFAWWSAEESSLVGSTYYVNNLSPAELDKIALYLNFDMVGSPNYGLFVYDGDNSAFPVGTGSAAGPPGSDVIESVFYGFFEGSGEFAEPTAFSGRSDYGPFIAKGIPAGGLFTGAEQLKTAAQVIKWGGTAGLAYDPCYHAACDTFANNADTALDVNSDAIAHATITFGQSTELINGVRGKGNFKRPYQGAEDGSGTGGDQGGLHDEHFFDES